MASLTFIVPARNAEETIDQALGSIVSQRLADYDVICVDDCSTDATRERMERWAERYPDHFRVIPSADLATPPGREVGPDRSLGVGACRNAALELARGDYVLFLDADDWLSAPPHSVAEALDRAAETDADMLIWDLWYYNDQLKRDQFPYVGTLNFGHWTGAEPFDFHRSPDWIFLSFQNWMWNKLFKRSFLQEGSGLRCSDLHRTEDLVPTCLALTQAKRIVLFWHRVSHYRILQSHLSNMGTVHKHPLDFANAFIELKRKLETAGVFDEVRRSYITWAVQSLSVNVDFLQPFDLYERVYGQLNDGLLDQMGIGDVRPEDLVLPGEFRKYEMLRTLSPGDYLAQVHAQQYRFLMERDGEVFALREELAVARGER